MNLANVLRIMSKALSEIAEELDKPAEPAVTGKPLKTRKVTVKKKTAEPVKNRASSKKKTARKTVTKKKSPVKSKVTPKKKKKTGLDIVLNAISRAKSPVNRVTISEKTGFKLQKVSDSLKILKKQGKIQTVKRGLYEKA